MYNFVIALINPNINFQLGFKEYDMARAEKERVKAFMKSGEDSIITVKDDYGHEMDVFANNIACVLIQEHKGNMEKQNDQNIDTQRANSDFIRRRNDDMELMRLFPSNQVQGGRA